MEFIDQLNNY